MIETDAFYTALDEGLAALAGGAPLEQVTRELCARYPALKDELPELLVAAHAAGAGAPPAPPPSRAQARSRAAFLGRAGALRQPARRRAWAIFSLPLARAALTVLVFAAGFGAGTYGAVVASADALPGEALYGIKRTVENTTLLLTGDAQTRSALEAEFTTRRVEEVRQLTNAGRTATVEFTGWLSALEGERWTVAGLTVVVPAGTPISGTPRPEVWVRVAGVVQPDRTVRAERVAVLADAEVPLPTATPAASAPPAPTRTPAPTATRTPPVGVGEDVEFTGVVQSMGAGAWQIGGQAVQVNAATDIRDNPQVGDTVEVRAVRQADGSLLATRIRSEDGGDDSAPAGSTPGGDDDDDGGDDDDDNSGSSATNTPEPGDDDDGDDDNSGSSATNTPGIGDGGDDDDDDDNSGPSPSNTPKPDEDDDDDNSGSSATDTPEPDDDDDSDDDDDDDNSGPSPSNTPEPDDDSDDDDDEDD